MVDSGQMLTVRQARRYPLSKTDCLSSTPEYSGKAQQHSTAEHSTELQSTAWHSKATAQHRARHNIFYIAQHACMEAWINTALLSTLSIMTTPTKVATTCVTHMREACSSSSIRQVPKSHPAVSSMQALMRPSGLLLLSQPPQPTGMQTTQHCPVCEKFLSLALMQRGLCTSHEEVLPTTPAQIRRTGHLRVSDVQYIRAIHPFLGCQD